MSIKYEAVFNGSESSIERDHITMGMSDVAQELNTLREAVVEAHRILLHELDNGRVPTMLKAEHGGEGLGYFEDLIK